MDNAWRDMRGMTLIELAIVITLLGILMAMAVPSFNRHFPTIRLQGDVRDVASIARLGRMRAIAERAQYGIFFDADQSPPEYVFFQDVDDDDLYDAGDDEVIFQRQLFSKTQLRHVGCSNDVVVFKTDGSSTGGWVSFGLADREDSLVVDVLPSTGRVKVIR